MSNNGKVENFISGFWSSFPRKAPPPRMKLYTSPSFYSQALFEILTGVYLKGQDIEKLEDTLVSYFQVPHALTIPTARVGIYFVLRSIIKPGQKVILSPYTIADVINMVVCAGGVPVFADIDRETCNINPAEIEKLIDKDTGAVLVTHFYGLTCEIEKISEICARYKVPLIEDAAQALGAKVGGKLVGTFGQASIFSFGLYKNVNSFLGGAILTQDQQLYDALRKEMATLPLQPLLPYLKKMFKGLITDIATQKYLFRFFTFWIFRYAFLNNVGALNNQLKIDTNPKLKKKIPIDYLVRMTPLQARLILHQWANIERDTAQRIKAAEIYDAGLKDLKELILPPLRTDGSHLYTYYPIQYDQRLELVRYASLHYRDIAESHHRNCANLPCFQEYARSCPNAEETARTLIYLPTYTSYGLKEVEKNVKMIRNFFGAS